jgi:hypothetical protein
MRCKNCHRSIQQDSGQNWFHIHNASTRCYPSRLYANGRLMAEPQTEPQVEPAPEGLNGNSVHWVEYTHVVRFPVNARRHNWFIGRAPESPADVREEVHQRIAHGQDVTEKITSRVISPDLSADQLRKIRDAAEQHSQDLA